MSKYDFKVFDVPCNEYQENICFKYKVYKGDDLVAESRIGYASAYSAIDEALSEMRKKKNVRIEERDDCDCDGGGGGGGGGNYRYEFELGLMVVIGLLDLGVRVAEIILYFMKEYPGESLEEFLEEYLKKARKKAQVEMKVEVKEVKEVMKANKNNLM